MKQKQRISLAIFEEMEKTLQPNIIFRREEERKDDRERPQLLTRTDKKKDELKSAQATSKNILNTQSPSLSNSRLL